MGLSHVFPHVFPVSMAVFPCFSRCNGQPQALAKPLEVLKSTHLQVKAADPVACSNGISSVMADMI
jgi:hypothetical protein